MRSREGFETWLEYEFYITGFVVLAALVVGAGRLVLAAFDRSPLSVIDILLYGGLTFVTGSLALAWWFGRNNR